MLLELFTPPHPFNVKGKSLFPPGDNGKPEAKRSGT